MDDAVRSSARRNQDVRGDGVQRVPADGVDTTHVIELGHRQRQGRIQVGDVADGQVGLEHRTERQREVEPREERVARVVQRSAEPLGRKFCGGELVEALAREEPVVALVPRQGEAHRRGHLGADPEAPVERSPVGVDDPGVGAGAGATGLASTHSRVYPTVPMRSS